MDKIIKIVNLLIYLFAIVLAILGIYALLFYALQGNHSLEDFGEITGIVLGISMAFEGVLWLSTKAIILLKTIPEIRKIFAFITKLLYKFHHSVGTLIISILILHYGLTLDLYNPFAFDQLTGYATTLFLIISLLFAIPSKNHKKLFKNIHIITAFASLICLLIHLLG